MASEKFEKAFKLCNKALEKPPSDESEHSHIISLKADAQVNLGNLAAAIQTYQEGISTLPTSSLLKMHLADIFLEMGEYQKVLELTALVNAQTPDPDALYLKAAAILYTPGEFASGTPLNAAAQAAVTLCNQALALSKDSVDALEIKGIALYKLGKIDEALQTLEAAYALDDERHDVLIFRAKIHNDRGTHDKALLSINRVLGMDTRKIDSRAWLIKATALAKLGRVDEALSALQSLAASADRAVVATSEDNALRIYRTMRLTAERAESLKREAAAMRFQILEESERYADIIKLLEPALKQFTAAGPTNTEGTAEFSIGDVTKPSLDVLLTYGEALQANSNEDEALNVARWTVEFYPNEAAAWYLKGTTAEAAGEYDEADEGFDKAIAFDPSNLDYYASRSGLLIGMEESRAALLLIHVALSREPENLLFQYLKAAAHISLDEFPDALAALDVILTKDESYNNYGAIEMRARAYLNDFQYPKAEQEYLRLLEKRGETAEGLISYAVTIAKQPGQDARALAIFDDAIKKFPTYDYPRFEPVPAISDAALLPSPQQPQRVPDQVDPAFEPTALARGPRPC